MITGLRQAAGARPSGRIPGKNVNTVYTQLTRARGLLRQALGGEDDA